MRKKTDIIKTFNMYIDDSGIINIIEQNHPTEGSSLEMKKKFFEIVKDLPKSRKVLVDLEHANIPPVKARKHIVEMFKSPKVGVVAMFGVSTPIRVLAGFLMHNARQKKSKFFSTKEEALTWLEDN